MIDLNTLMPIGSFAKPHGHKGEITLMLSQDFDTEHCDCIIAPIDEIPVPFFVREIRTKGCDALLVTFDGLNSDNEVRMLSNMPAYIDRQWSIEYDDDERPLSSLIGYHIVDSKHGDIGAITDINDSTANTLFVLGDYLIPVADEFISSIDNDTHIIYVQLPEGLLNIND